MDKDPIKCAQYYHDSFVVKKCTEMAQLLSTAHRFSASQAEADKLKLYAATKKDSPYVFWCSGEVPYRWCFNLFEALLDEHKFRFEEEHPAEFLREVLTKQPAFFRRNYLNLHLKSKSKKLPKPLLMMPSWYWLDNGMKSTKSLEQASAVHSYRNFYTQKETVNSRYTKRLPPQDIFDLYYRILLRACVR